MPKRKLNTKFYTYSQNNSGGFYKKDDKEGIAKYVIIEALDYKHANQRAEEIGLYFDGCWNSIDCSCCGDRWREASESDASNYPSIYDTPIEDVKKSTCRNYCFVHYLDGKVEKVEFKEEK